MNKIKIGIVGIGNCASSLVQGIEYYRSKSQENAIGLMHWNIGGYLPGDIDVVAAWDIDERKVGMDVAEAIFAKPNCTKVFCPHVQNTGAVVRMGRVSDGCSEHMLDFEDDYTFVVAAAAEPEQNDIVKTLRESGAEILLNYLPVGSEKATKIYAECALAAGVAFINNMPVFIASDPAWAARLKEANLPIIGDDIKAQLGATITHRTLTDLFRKRGVKLERTYQLNTGGNTDFLNMLNRQRLASKKISKTEAVQSAMKTRLMDRNIHVGPSDYVPWQDDNKVCFCAWRGNCSAMCP